MKVDIYNTDKKYNIIYADPPWSYKVWSKRAWYKNVHIKSKYCPNCGAKMDKENET